jgi:sugar phosphate permease
MTTSGAGRRGLLAPVPDGPMLKEPLIGEDQTAAKAKWQKLVFLITFLNYAMAHFSRKCYTNVKTDLVAAGVDKIILSQMDTAFMFTCAARSYSLA